MIPKLLDYKSSRKYEDGMDEAHDVFMSQASSIQSIRGELGYKAIKSYFMSQVDIARERLKTMGTMDDLVRVQTTLKDAEDFLNYLAQMESITK